MKTLKILGLIVLGTSMYSFSSAVSAGTSEKLAQQQVPRGGTPVTEKLPEGKRDEGWEVRVIQEGNTTVPVEETGL